MHRYKKKGYDNNNYKIEIKQNTGENRIIGEWNKLVSGSPSLRI